jgi:hypothetical protein
MIGYVTPEEAAKIEARTGSLHLRFYPEPYASSTRVVSLPVARVLLSKAPSRDEGNYLTLEL